MGLNLDLGRFWLDVRKILLVAKIGMDQGIRPFPGINLLPSDLNPLWKTESKSEVLLYN